MIKAFPNLELEVEKEKEKLRESLLKENKVLKMGYLEIFCGSMYSGKSSALSYQATRHADVGLKVLYINHILDNRQTEGDNVFSTHNSQYSGLSKKVKAVKVGNLSEAEELVANYHAIFVDECNFYDDLVPLIDKWVTRDHKIVYCAGLDGDSFRKPFGHLLELIPLCNNITKFKAKCAHCLQQCLAQPEEIRGDYYSSVSDAPFTARTCSSKEQTLIGGKDLYIPLCRHHYDLHLSS